jgi:3',5'-cyclic AMP phosphodiesterase CpdA
MRIIHLSDLHIGSGENLEKTQILLDRIDEKYGNEQKKPVILITGDIVDDAKAWQFKEANDLFQPFISKRYQFLLCPGNHDYGWNGMKSRPENIKKYGKFLSQDTDFPVIEKIGDCYFIALDSMEAETGIYDSYGAEGEMGKDQIDDLNYYIEDIKSHSPNDKIILYLHHHPFFYNHFMRLKDADKLKEVIRIRSDDEANTIKKVNILLFGHKHAEKQLKPKESKYGIDLILASKKSTDIEIGTRFYEIDTETYSAIPVEVLVKRLT